jgi:hypothetical protein
MPSRRFPPPWDIEEHNRSCFIVHDNNGQALAYVYFQSEAGRCTAANLLTRDETAHRGECRQAAGAAHSTAVLVAVKRDRTRGLNRR